MIANRVKKNTLVYKALMKFLETLNIPVVATLRDSQNYIRGAESGLGLFEMKPNQVREDMEQWLPLIGWLAQRRPLHIAPGTPAITSAASVNSLPVAAPAAAAPVVSPRAVIRRSRESGRGADSGSRCQRDRSGDYAAGTPRSVG